MMHSKDTGHNVGSHGEQPTKVAHVCAQETYPLVEAHLRQMLASDIHHRVGKVDSDDLEIGAARGKIGQEPAAAAAKVDDLRS